MTKKTDVLAEEMNELAQDFERLWRALTRDPNKEARRDRAWAILSGAFGAAATMAARRALAKLWPILTGEQPPTYQPASTRTEQRARPAEQVGVGNDEPAWTSRG
jgi:hypothetical protein